MLPFSLPDKVLSHMRHYTGTNTQLHLTATTIATCITAIIIIIIIRMNETLMPYHHNEASNTMSTSGLTTTLTFDL